MRFTIATVLAFAATTLAAVGVDVTPGFDSVNTPNQNEQVPAGKPYVVKWTNPAPYADGQIYIQLLAGKDSATLVVKTDRLVTLNNNAQQYSWNVDSSLGDDDLYGLRFVWAQDESIVQYSKQFHIQKAEGGSTTTGSSSQSGSTTVTVTSSQGTKTITLSSTTTTSTTTTTTSSVISTSSAAPNTTVARNTTTAASTTVSRTTLASSSAGTTTTGTPTPKPSSGAVRAAGSIAAIGGLVAALLAL